MIIVKPHTALTAYARCPSAEYVGVSHLQICLTELSDLRGLDLPHSTPSLAQREFIGAFSERGVAGQRIAHTISGALRFEWSPCDLGPHTDDFDGCFETKAGDGVQGCCTWLPSIDLTYQSAWNGDDRRTSLRQGETS